MYEEEPEVSPNVVLYLKFASIVTMIGTPFVFLSYFLKESTFGLSLMALMFVFFVGATIIFTRKRKYK